MNADAKFFNVVVKIQRIELISIIYGCPGDPDFS